MKNERPILGLFLSLRKIRTIHKLPKERKSLNVEEVCEDVKNRC